MPNIITRLFSRGNRSDESFAGAIRIGGAEYNMTWSHARLLQSVYKNPTGYRVIEDTANEFMRPEWAMFNGTDRLESDPFLKVLNNPFTKTTGTTMQYHISRDLDINGGTFLVKMRGADYWGDNGPVTGFKRLPPQRVSVMTDDDDELLGFIYTDRAGRRAPILPEEIVYIHFPDGERAWHRQPPAAVAGLPADIDNAAMRFNAELLDNDGGLPGYLVVEGLTPKVFKEWVTEWRSGESPGKTRVLASGGGGPGSTGKGNASYVRVGVTNSEMMYDRLREMAHDDICLSLGMPPVLLNPDGTTFSNMDTAKRFWVVGRVYPRWVWVRDAFTVQMQGDLPENKKIGFNLEIIEELTENLDSTVSRELQILEARGQTINQFLQKIGREPVSWGDVEPQAAAGPVLTGDNNQPVVLDVPKEKKIIVVDTKAPKQRAYLDGLHSIIEGKEQRAAEMMHAMFLSQGEAIAARIRSKQGKAYRKAVEDWWDGDRWNTAVSQVVSASYNNVVGAAGDFVMNQFQPGSEFDATTKNISDWLANRSVEVAGLINGTTQEEVRSVIADLASTSTSVEQISRAVKGYFSDNAEMRATRFARTEMVGGANYAAEQAAKQTGLILVKGISSASTADEDCTSLDDERVPLDGTFSNGLGAPPIHPNCRCALVFEEVES